MTACPQCSEPVAKGAKFCPRCGKPAPASPTLPVHASVDLGKLSAPIPLGGIVFLVSLILGPAALVAGIVLGASWLILVGIVILIGLVLLLVLGQFL